MRICPNVVLFSIMSKPYVMACQRSVFFLRATIITPPAPTTATTADAVSTMLISAKSSARISNSTLDSLPSVETTVRVCFHLERSLSASLSISIMPSFTVTPSDVFPSISTVSASPS